MHDIRDVLFSDIKNKVFRAEITAERNGVLSGEEAARQRATEIGISLNMLKREGDTINTGDTIAVINACPKKMAMAEETVIGTLSKASGIASAARRGVELAEGRLKIVCGSWKKMPPETKHLVRQAVTAGGASFRISSIPMIYIDKNYIQMLGSISNALGAASAFPDYVKVVQIKGFLPVDVETNQALEGGCTIFMVDTGKLEDLEICLNALEKTGRRRDVQVAFAGNVKLNQIPHMVKWDIDILCIGKEIVDAQLLDMRLDVTSEVVS